MLSQHWPSLVLGKLTLATAAEELTLPLMSELAQHSGKMALPFTMDVEDLVLLPWARCQFQQPRLTKSANTQTHNQGFELVYSNVYPDYDLPDACRD